MARMCCKRCEPRNKAVRAARHQICSFIWALVCVAGLFAATVGHDLLTQFIQTGIAQQFVLDSPNAGAYAPFIDSDNSQAGAILSSYWMFNLTNPEEFLAGKAPPNLQEIGPLNYRYHNKKFNVTWEDEGNVISYQEYQYYELMSESDALMEQQNITSVNLLLLGALLNPAQYQNLLPFVPAWKDPANWVTTRTMKEWLWGYEDVVDGLVPITFPGLQQNDTSLGYSARQHGYTKMYTGKSATTGVQFEYKLWDSMTNLTCCANGPAGEANAGGGCAPLWDTWDANQIRGTYGANFHNYIDPSETLWQNTYDFGIYRHWPLECRDVGAGPGPGWLYEGGPLSANIGGCQSYDVKGIPVLNFTLPDWVLGNYSVSLDEASAYGINGPSGILDVSACEQKAPIMLSLPHFLGASPQLLEGVTGMAPPDPALHGTWVGIEPITGQTLDTQFRIGINARVGTINTTSIFGDFSYYPNVATVVLPLAWGQQISEATDSQADDIKSSLYLGLRVLVGLRWGGTALAGLGFIVAVVLQITSFFAWKRAVEEGRIDPSEDELEMGLRATKRGSAASGSAAYTALSAAASVPTGSGVGYPGDRDGMFGGSVNYGARRAKEGYGERLLGGS